MFSYGIKMEPKWNSLRTKQNGIGMDANYEMNDCGPGLFVYGNLTVCALTETFMSYLSRHGLPA